MFRRLLFNLRRSLYARRFYTGANATAAAPGGTDFHLDLGPDYRPRTARASGPELEALPRRRPDGQYALEMERGESFVTPPVVVGSEHVLRLEACGGSERSPCAVTTEIEAPDGTWHMLSTVVLRDAAIQQPVQLGLAGFRGERRFRVTAAAGNPAPCWIFLLQVCAKGRSGLVNARSSYAYRLEREVSNFSCMAYTHAMYGDQVEGDASAGVRAASVRMDGLGEAYEAGILAAAHDALDRIEVQPGDNAFGYCARALVMLIPANAPDFFGRAASLGRTKGKLRLLSILAGAARIEEQIVRHCGVPVSITLIDASEDLIRRAATRLRDIRDDVEVECLVGDINAGLPGEGQFDLVICASALHHVVELERVLAQVNARLVDEGEFWSIGEQIGRNGNRLWPEAYEAADRAFRQLPGRYRKNAATGRVDDFLTDHDFSTSCFEGIRSEELEHLLEANFLPEHVYKKNAFLWRLVDATYGDNFDLTRAEDLAALRGLVAAEATHWSLGGRSTELHGIYRKKRLRVGQP
jgi:SAM-dependent methyltransferase